MNSPPSSAKPIVTETGAETPPRSATGENMVLGELEDILGFLLRLSARASDRKVIPILSENGFTRVELTTLMIIAYNPDRSLQEIARTVGVELPATQRMVNALLKKGYVVRRRPDHDRRITLYTATPAGHEHMERVKDRSNIEDRKLLAGFSTEERQELFRMLRRIGLNVVSEPSR